jgi:RNA polymerase sigma factor (sigma-70 family)
LASYYQTNRLVQTNWAEIVQRCKSGDRHAQSEAYRLSWRIIYPSVYLIMRNREDAEDIMQEAYIKGFNKLADLTAPEKYVAWQKMICVREAISRVRRKKNFTILFPEFNENIKDQIEEKDERYDIPTEQLAKHIGKLPQGYQMIIQLHIMEKMSHQEIGDQLGIGASTSRSQYSRALTKLRKEIGVEK